MSNRTVKDDAGILCIFEILGVEQGSDLLEWGDRVVLLVLGGGHFIQLLLSKVV